MIATITSKGQLTIPKSIRDHLNLRAGDKVNLHIGEGRTLEMKPLSRPITRLKGMVPKPERVASLEDIQEAIEIEGSTL